MKMLFFSVLLTCVGCTPANNPIVDAGDAATDAANDSDAPMQANASACARMCKSLLAIGCSEAKVEPPGDCLSTCENIKSQPGMALNVECIAAAKTISQVRKCGTVRCALPLFE